MRQKGRLSNNRELRRIWNKAAPIPKLCEEDLALDFARQLTSELRYVAAWGKWLIWADGIWRFDEMLEAVDRIRAFCRDRSSRCHDEKIAFRIASLHTVTVVEKLARADPFLSASTDQWDRDRLTLLAGKGPDATAIELDTATERPPRREDYFTKSTAVAPGGDDGCPQWLAFLADVTAGDQVLQNYLQRVAGYCLSGLIDEHAMFFLWGTGSNGKSVFINTLVGIWGDYAAIAPMETFIDSPTDRHPTELAHLRGARLVVAQETEKGRRWAEAKIKSITGGDRISARFMRQDFFEFRPAFKLVGAGNHKPSLRSVDEAIRRRLHLIPFAVTIPAEERDVELVEKLKVEWPGILAWMMEWQKNGLRPPRAVREATEAYMAAEDAIAAWIDDKCERDAKEWSALTLLFRSWSGWAQAAGEIAGAMKTFADALVTRGFVRHKRNCGQGFWGHRVKLDEAPPPHWQDGK